MPEVAWIHSGEIVVVLQNQSLIWVEMSSFSSSAFERRDVLYTFIRRKREKYFFFIIALMKHRVVVVKAVVRLRVIGLVPQLEVLVGTEGIFWLSWAC